MSKLFTTLLLLFFLIFISETIYSQQIGVFNEPASGDLKFGYGATELMRLKLSGALGIGATANAASILDISSTTKGVLIPRMTNAQRTAMNPLTVAAQGLLVYQTDGTEGFYYNTSITTTPNWVYIASGISSWTRSAPYLYLTNKADSVGIGTLTPTAKLHVAKTGGLGDAVLITTDGNASKALNIFHTGTTGFADYGVYSSATGLRGGGSSNTAGYFYATNAGTNYGVYAIADGGNNSIGGYFSGNGSITSSYAAIFDQGNVGIGTTSPLTSLDVNEHTLREVQRQQQQEL